METNFQIRNNLSQKTSPIHKIFSADANFRSQDLFPRQKTFILRNYFGRRSFELAKKYSSQETSNTKSSSRMFFQFLQISANPFVCARESFGIVFQIEI